MVQFHKTSSGLQARSIADEREYCGWVLWEEGEIFAGSANKGDIDSCELPETPEGAVALASFHTHGDHDPDYYSEVPSTDDVEGDFEEETFGYVSTPGGRVWLIDPDQEELFLICGEGCVHADANYDAGDYPQIPEVFSEETLEEFLAE